MPPMLSQHQGYIRHPKAIWTMLMARQTPRCGERLADLSCPPESRVPKAMRELVRSSSAAHWLACCSSRLPPLFTAPSAASSWSASSFSSHVDSLRRKPCACRTSSLKISYSPSHLHRCEENTEAMSVGSSGICRSCRPGERSARRTHRYIGVLMRQQGLLFIMRLSSTGATRDALPHDGRCILDPILRLLH